MANLKKLLSFYIITNHPYTWSLLQISMIKNYPLTDNNTKEYKTNISNLHIHVKNNGISNYKNVDTTVNVMLTNTWIKFTASIIKVLHLEGSSTCAVYWCILGRRVAYKRHSTSSWIKNFDTRCLYVCNHIQYKLQHINTFFSTIYQHHTVYSTHIFIFIATMMYF